MSTLWIFGDSFAHDRQDGRPAILEQQWHRLLGKELGFDIENSALSGAGLDYVYDRWYHKKDLIKADDLVIVAATDMNRRWVFQDHPECSNPVNLFQGTYDRWVEPHRIKAARNYFKVLDHEGASRANFYNWLCALDKKASEDHVRVLILPCFSDSADLLNSWKDQFKSLYIAKGDLCEISNGEHIESLKIGQTVWLFQDGRCNHMSPPNHRLLFSKILDWVRSGTEIDIPQGIYTDLIKESDFDDENLLATRHILAKKF